MPEISVAHAYFRETNNVGDLMSPPALYFDIPGTLCDFRSIPPSDVVIFGGGTLGRLQRNKFSARVAIAWGVGVSRHGEKLPGPAPEGFDLYGSRHWQQPDAIYAPCASCMSPLFDHDYRLTDQVAVYLNADPNVRRKCGGKFSGVRVAFNTGSFEASLSFLGSAEIVVTDSYHGALWATWLRRRVVCLPYSLKFFGYKFPPAYAENGDWQRAVSESRIYPEALDCDRADTRAFHEQVRGVLHRAGHASPTLAS